VTLANGSAADRCVAASTKAGETSLCANCECGSCATAASTCFASGDAKKDAACSAVAACEHQNGCSGDACYCGSDPIGCLFKPSGPCVAQIDAAIGGHGPLAVAIARGDANNPLTRAEALVTCGQSQCAVPCAAKTATCSLFTDLACQDRICKLDSAREAARAASAATPSVPSIQQILVNGSVVWQAGSTQKPVLVAGQQVTLRGSGFGNGTDVDFAKILVGNARVLETDLTMYDQKLDLATQVNYEVLTTHGNWPRDVVRWSDGEIVFRVPAHASGGPLVVQVQKRLPANTSLLRPGEPHLVVDAQTERIRDAVFTPGCDVVSGLGAPVSSPPVDVTVQNPGFSDLVARGRKIFWSYDYNIGTAHSVRNLDWPTILAGKGTDPMTGGAADPLALFGAYPANRGEVPDEAIDDVAFNPYPQPSPIPGFLGIGAQLMSGNTQGTGRVGYRYAQSVNPLVGNGAWIGFNCASCHGYRVTYEAAPGQSVTRVVPGLPNPTWSMKWATIGGTFTGIKANEPGPRWAPGTSAVDKTALVYSIPQGTGEHSIVRLLGEGSHTDNDYQFSPIAIPNVTHHLPIRRALSHTESYVGFEGSYVHSEEPDGAMGSMYPDALQALTAYMSTLDEHDTELRRVGLYRWLEWTGALSSQVGSNVTEGSFVQSGEAPYLALQGHLARGKQIFASRCGSCHSDGVGANTTEVMIRLDQVGRFFAPTIYQKQTQAIRATFLRDLYFTQHRGLLSDGHVRNLTDLVDPARCTKGSPLYNAYYTLHAPADPGPAGPDFPTPYPSTGRRGDVFRVPRAASLLPGDAAAQKNLFIERHRYFVTVPWDSNYYYWDYQKMRAEYGPAELGTAKPIGMPDAPHPWCAGNAGEVDDLVEYLVSL
jgi:hypothetical protein